VNGVVTKYVLFRTAEMKCQIAVGNWAQCARNFEKIPTKYLTIAKMMIMIMMVVVVSKRIEIWDE